MANPPLERGNNFKRDRYQQLMDLGFSEEWIEKVSLHHTALFENPRAKIEALRQRGFDNFNADNDPHGEHDFGSFELEGEKLFWKIDLYERRPVKVESIENNLAPVRQPPQHGENDTVL